MNLKVSNSVTTKTYALTNVAPAKPYLNVSNSFLPLTTNTTSGLKLKVTKNNKTYRALEYGTVSSSDTFYTSANVSDGLSSTTGLTRASTSGTTYLTRASTSGTNYGTRASTSNTVYGTRASTSGTKYGTRASTSATSYLTRASTSGTTYLTRASTSGTISSTYYTSCKTYYFTHCFMTYTDPSGEVTYRGHLKYEPNNFREFLSWASNSNNITQNKNWTYSMTQSINGNYYSYNFGTSYPTLTLWTSVPNRTFIMSTSNKPYPWLAAGNYNYNSANNIYTYYTSLSSCKMFTCAYVGRNYIQGNNTYSNKLNQVALSFHILMAPGATYPAGYLTRASTSNTVYGTRASTSNTVYGTRASTSGTTYLTRASTSGTTYYTRVSTSGTTYLTRASTSGTNYGTRASTSGYSGVSSSSNSTTSWI